MIKHAQSVERTKQDPSNYHPFSAVNRILFSDNTPTLGFL